MEVSDSHDLHWQPITIIHNNDRMSSSTWVLHTKTWVNFIAQLPLRFNWSSKEVKEAIMKDINDLVEDFWTFSDEAIELSFYRCVVCF